MKKLFLILITLVILMSSTSLAATKQDVINAINAYYQVGDTNFRLPQKYINKGEAYLNSHPLTSEQYDRILGCIYSAVAYAREIGHVRYKEYTKEQINKGLSFVLAACKAAEVDLSSEMKNNADDLHNIETQTNITASNNASNANQNKVVDTPDEDNLKESVVESTSGELVQSGENGSGEAFAPIEKIDALVETIKYTEDDLDREINRKLFFIYLFVFSIIIINILLIRLLFKKKWNKILKNILIVVLSVITLALLIITIISIYYIEELKIIYELYYLLK